MTCGRSARLISLVENGAPRTPRGHAGELAPLTGRARVLGLTGAPGVGKSTVTGALVAAYRERGLRVGVLAVDPTSPFTGGALLGDRVRMQDHATDQGVFIRSMASRGHLGGLAGAAPQALRVLDAAGFELILVETVGVGQAEVEIASLADSTLVIVAPGMGDAIQAAKAGILEIGDVFVVNKSDKPGAQETVRDLRTHDRHGPARRGGLEAADRAHRRGGPARASPTWPPSSTRTGPGWTPRARGTAGGWPGRGRDHRDRTGRAAAADGRAARRLGRSTSWPPGWRPASWTPTRAADELIAAATASLTWPGLLAPGWPAAGAGAACRAARRPGAAPSLGARPSPVAPGPGASAPPATGAMAAPPRPRGCAACRRRSPPAVM